MIPEEDAIRATNEAFYKAFRERDADAMEDLWARRAPVVCLHPGMDAIVGREAVMKSWRGILQRADAPSIRCARVSVNLIGDTAFVICLEGTTGRRPALIATNIYVRESDGWRIAHHQAAPLSVEIEHEPLTGPSEDKLLN